MTMPPIAEKYQVIGQVGRGGMGVVYQVRHLTLQTVLAVKVLPPELAENPELVSRFHQEARLMAQLRHPNIVRVLDVDKAGDSHYFVMEYIAGKSLSRYVREQGPLSVPEVLELARQVASALEYAHKYEPPVIHRDIKPDNILLEEHTGRAVVTDFGIAKVLGMAGQTSTGLVLGTLLYCAPEQVLRPQELDGRADIYSLGLVMYEMAAGRPFFAGLDERALLGRVLRGPEENVPTFAGAMPPEFVALVTRSIARDPQQRYARATDLLQDIEKCLGLYTHSTATRHIAELEAATPPALPAAASLVHQQMQKGVQPKSTHSVEFRFVLSLFVAVLVVAFFSYRLVHQRWMRATHILARTPAPLSSAPPLATRAVNQDGARTLAESVEEPGNPANPEALYSSHPIEQPLLPPRRYRVTSRTVVRDQPTWKGVEVAQLKPNTKIHVVALTGDWLKVESRSKPPKPPGYVWKDDARPE